MSNRSRLILLSGVGGAGTSTLAQATVDVLRAEGVSTALVDGSGPVPADPAAIAAVAEPVGRLFAELGADPVLPEAWATMAGISHLSTLTRAAAALEEVEAVVVDAGSYERARELVQLPVALLLLLDSALTPRMAMWRSARGEDVAFTAMSAARLTVLRLAHLLAHPATTARLVTVPRPDATERTARALGVLSMLGVAVDGIVVNRFPRSGDGATDRVQREARTVLDAVTAAADGVTVWKSTSRVRPAPKGRSALGPLGRVRVLDAEQLTVQVGDGDFALELPLAGPARRDARVGVQGERLVVAFDGAMRWLDLPPVLRRCDATRAARTGSGLRVSFVPDPSTWPEPAESASPA